MKPELTHDLLMITFQEKLEMMLNSNFFQIQISTYVSK